MVALSQEENLSTETRPKDGIKTSQTIQES